MTTMKKIRESLKFDRESHEKSKLEKFIKERPEKDKIISNELNAHNIEHDVNTHHSDFGLGDVKVGVSVKPENVKKAREILAKVGMANSHFIIKKEPYVPDNGYFHRRNTNQAPNTHWTGD